jgi:AcrR family transcriptional regulator
VTTAERRLRADAERNRRLLLDAAAEAFAERGLDVCVSEIARRAGVGQGTVFRRFPTKDALIAAVIADRIDELADLGEQVLDEEPWDALVAFMEALVQRHLEDRALYEALECNAMGDPGVQAAQARLYAALDGIVERARAAGVVRPDLDPVDVPFLALGVSHAAYKLTAVSPEIWRRFLAVVLAGLAPDGSPLPVRALSFEAVAEACGRPAR